MNMRIAIVTIAVFIIFWAKLIDAQPVGYYNSAEGLTGAPLKTALYNIIKDHTQRTYTNLWTDFQSTDVRADGKVWDMYSATNYTFVSNQCATSGAPEGSCYNREHSIPSSWFADAYPMYTDLFHLFPVDGYVNNIRSNNPFAKVGIATYTSTNGSKRGNCITPGYSGTVFEPIDEYKGDFARSLFYMVTRYENVVAGWYANSANTDVVFANNSFPVFEDWYKAMLIQWHVLDPVSTKEINRNNAVYAIQGNRNPYIDHPEYVAAVWDAGSVLAIEPTNHAADFSATTITLQWTDAIGGTLPDGYLVSMSATDFNAIPVPLDGTAVANDFNNKNVYYGIGKVVFGSLSAGQVYYFKIFPYKSSGLSIDYKTDGTIQQVSLMAQ